MSVREELTRIQNGKEDLINAINEKGVSVPSDTPIEQLGAKVREISAGGGSSGTSGQYSEGLEYTLLSDDTYAVISIGACTDDVITIPSNYNGKSVTSINAYAFEDNIDFRAMIIPSSVTSIGGFAFTRCYNLSNLILHDGLVSIGNQAFIGCEAMTSLTIPDSVTSIEYSAFRGAGLVSIKFPNRLTNIPNEVCEYCESLTSVVIPDSVTSIGGFAFDGCYSLKNIKIGDSVTSIGTGAFRHCESLTAVEIPSSVTSIGSSAFAHCYNLETAVFTTHTSVPTIGTVAFYGCHEDLQILVPANLYDEWIEETNWSDWADKIVAVLPASVGLEYSDEDVYYNDSGYAVIGIGTCTDTDIVIPPTYNGEPVVEIGFLAFGYNDDITSVIIPDTVTALDGCVFEECPNLESVTFGSGVREIYDSVFYWCSNLKRVDLSRCSTIPYLDMDAFFGCHDDLQIKVPADLYDEWIEDTNWSEWADYIVTEFTN